MLGRLSYSSAASKPNNWKKDFDKFALYIARFYAESDEYRVDGRNEIAVNFYHEIDAIEDHTFEKIFQIEDIQFNPVDPYNKDEDDWYVKFVKQFVRILTKDMHRTNQQTLAKVVFYSLNKNYEEISKVMLEKYGDTWYNLPMI